MALDWVQLSSCAQLAASVGAGDFVLSASAVDGGYNILTAANDGEYIFYGARPTAANASDNEFEEGGGIYTHSTRTWARTDVFQSTNADSKVVFTNAPIVYPVFGGELIRRLDLVLNLSGAGTVAGVLAALSLEDSDINTLINARIAAMQASGALPPDPSALQDGTGIQVSGGAYTTLT